MMIPDLTLGQVNFDAYRAKKQGHTYDAKPIPSWEAVGDDVREAWEAAAQAVKEQVELDSFIAAQFRREQKR